MMYVCERVSPSSVVRFASCFGHWSLARRPVVESARRSFIGVRICEIWCQNQNSFIFIFLFRLSLLDYSRVDGFELSSSLECCIESGASQDKEQLRYNSLSTGRFVDFFYFQR
jgi:hypothetical protein